MAVRACLVNTLALLCLSFRLPGCRLVLIWLRTWTHACTRQQRQAQASKNERLDDREVAWALMMYCAAFCSTIVVLFFYYSQKIHRFAKKITSTLLSRSHGKDLLLFITIIFFKSRLGFLILITYFLFILTLFNQKY